MSVPGSNEKLSYRRDSAHRRSLRRSRLFKVTDVSTNRKPICDFLLVNYANLHIIPISHRFPVPFSSGQMAKGSRGHVVKRSCNLFNALVLSNSKRHRNKSKLRFLVLHFCLDSMGQYSSTLT